MRIRRHKLDVVNLQILFVPCCTAIHCEHLGRCVVNKLHTTIATGLQGAHGNVLYPQNVVQYFRASRHDLAAVVREEGDKAAPPTGLVHKDIRRASCCPLRGGHGVHVEAAAETTGQNEDT